MVMMRPCKSAACFIEYATDLLCPGMSMECCCMAGNQLGVAAHGQQHSHRLTANKFGHLQGHWPHQTLMSGSQRAH